MNIWVPTVTFANCPTTDQTVVDDQANLTITRASAFLPTNLSSYCVTYTRKTTYSTHRCAKCWWSIHISYTNRKYPVVVYHVIVMVIFPKLILHYI